MPADRRLAACVLAAALGGCGGSGGATTPGAAPSSATAPATAAPAARERCGSIRVPGHVATGIVATAGIGCSVAKDVAADAEGRGRAAYLSTGFSCRPASAAGGDTVYRCGPPSRRISFRYGAG